MMKMNTTFKQQLCELASRYETSEFLKDDPSQFMHRYHESRDIEIVAWVASCLSLGQRPQILAKIEYICQLMGEHPADWILRGKYQETFPLTTDKFYRFFSFAQMHHLFDALKSLLEEYGSLGLFVKGQYELGISPLNALVGYFGDKEVGQLVPRNTASCCKRLNMFLRWMVRTHSSVDMGLWKWYETRNLIIPVDTHVIQEAVRLGIVHKPGSTLAKALEITQVMQKVWPDDPCRGDFALFGLGINS
jgi:uncharacterized protein (TIGR02757 family)